jgi:hypothetical protein
MDLNKLVSGYEKMLTDIGVFIEGAEDTAQQNIEIAFENAKENIAELKEFTEEEIEHIQRYLIRDLKHASESAKISQKELADWFKFDIKLLESRLWETVFSIADPTWLSLSKFKEAAFHHEYKTGQLTGPSSLQCTSCGKTHHFYKVSHIPPCSKCKKTSFKRIE